MRLYLDSAPIIYLVEGAPDVRMRVANRLAGTRSGDDVVVVSHLSRLECRVKPLQDGNRQVLDRYDQFFAAEGAELVNTDPSVWDTATELCARHGLRVPDALHIACAIVHRCDRFLTHDLRLQRIPEISVEILGP